MAKIIAKYHISKFLNPKAWQSKRTNKKEIIVIKIACISLQIKSCRSIVHTSCTRRCLFSSNRTLRNKQKNKSNSTTRWCLRPAHLGYTTLTQTIRHSTTRYGCILNNCREQFYSSRSRSSSKVV